MGLRIFCTISEVLIHTFHILYSETQSLSRKEFKWWLFLQTKFRMKDPEKMHAMFINDWHEVIQITVLIEFKIKQSKIPNIQIFHALHQKIKQEEIWDRRNSLFMSKLQIYGQNFKSNLVVTVYVCPSAGAESMARSLFP